MASEKIQLNPSGPPLDHPMPKYGYLSELDPVWAKMEDAVKNQSSFLWSLPLSDFKQACLDTPVMVPDGAPELGKDYQTEDQTVSVRDGTKIGVRFYKPMRAVENGVLFLKIHGGGWTIGSHEIEEIENRMLAARAGALVCSVDYRLAPAYKYPFAVNDSFDVLTWCITNAKTLGVDPRKVFVGGGSAGGNLAAVLAQKARDEGGPQIIGQVLNIPVTCHPKHFPSAKYENGSMRQNKDSAIVDKPKMEWFWDQYLPNAEPEVYANPLLAKDLSGLPPALVQVSGQDPLRDEGIAYAEALKAAGVDVTLKIFKGLPHGFYFLNELKQSKQYLDNVVEFVKAVSSGKRDKVSGDWQEVIS